MEAQQQAQDDDEDDVEQQPIGATPPSPPVQSFYPITSESSTAGAAAVERDNTKHEVSSIALKVDLSQDVVYKDHRGRFVVHTPSLGTLYDRAAPMGASLESDDNQRQHQLQHLQQWNNFVCGSRCK